MSKYETIRSQLREEPKIWLVTGVAGFIGSNLLETLLRLNQQVIGLDNFSTGHQSNLDDVRSCISDDQWKQFRLVHGDIRDLEDCKAAVSGVDFVLHQAALGSVPRSIDNPILTNENNISGFLNMLVASRDEEVKSFTYAASSSTYGDHPGLPKIESEIGRPLSPYAVTKYVNELYADVFARSYGFQSIGLRYFNVFGPRQDPNGAYAAVIPRWIASMMRQEEIVIHGDGQTSRDFCFIENAVQANILAATADDGAKNSVYNVAIGDRTSLHEMYQMINVAIINLSRVELKAMYRFAEFRPGDVRHSMACIDKATSILGYSPSVKIGEGVEKSVKWFADRLVEPNC